ncbi:PhzF family phenazine biosynthesis protein [Scopulibacillus darangshiensis]|uniref:PhzF family phenazine biosynthesis protein n=1 Tax=Scopulibacillus darangshiensis TaxID=442528 RepID=A0A4R2P5K3_9BACL|nr:PhzF family phenazine biosynthesis protein [Scopulibacillus darangshiensis]TCP29394.1 PhzF family phenazine biosynthesis protein [Scopulibacillus darangshiensis]
MSVRFYHINAFAKEPFSGNPACVLILEDPKSDAWMGQIAKELNQPVSAFVYKLDKEYYSLKWFTPTHELDLCGHGTLGAAHILWEKGVVSKHTALSFQTKSGSLAVDYTTEGIRMPFPADPSRATDYPETLTRALNVPFKNVERNQQRYIVELENEDSVKELKPDFELLAQLPVTGVIVTSTSSKYDFISRYFPPRIGIKEDYVTGSAHCGLAPYWSERLGKQKLRAYQASERGGEMNIELKEKDVYLTGKAITLTEGELVF